MKKIYVLGLPLLFLFWRCTENDRMTWESQSGVYFSEYTTEADSLQYSFRITGVERDTIALEIKLQGALLEQPAKFQVEIDETSTAIAGTHYEPLQESYLFPAHQTTTVLPVVILKKGDELDDKTVTLSLKLKPTEELDVALPGQQQMRLVYTNQLIKPYYWDMPLSLYFGDYSQVKHLKCIEIMGHDFPLKQEELRNWQGVPIFTYWMRAGREVCYYYATHTENDEHGNPITPWETL